MRVFFRTRASPSITVWVYAQGGGLMRYPLFFERVVARVEAESSEGVGDIVRLKITLFGRTAAGTREFGIFIKRSP